MNILITLPIQYLFPNKLFKKRIFCYFCFITYIKHFNLGSLAQLRPIIVESKEPMQIHGSSTWLKSHDRKHDIEPEWKYGDVISYVHDTSILCNQDNLHKSKLLVTESLDVLLLGEVHVHFPPGSGNKDGCCYSYPGQILECDQIHPAPVFDPKTQKQVFCTIWKPRMGTFQNVLDTMLRETLKQSKGQQRMGFCSEEVVDVDRQSLYALCTEGRVDVSCFPPSSNPIDTLDGQPIRSTR
jgi:hypothetical protein